MKNLWILLILAVATGAIANDAKQEAKNDEDKPKRQMLFTIFRPIMHDMGSRNTEKAEVVSGPVEAAVCPHGGDPPRCWCRPPLPGLPLAFARTHNADPARSLLVGARPAHRTLATTLGARYVHV